MLRAEAERISATGLPLDIFPSSVQKIILDVAKYENFNVEYSACAVLSAVASSIGNSCRIRVRNNWTVAPNLYMMLIGRPGIGKTPPLSFFYRPIVNQDNAILEKFRKEYSAYQAEIASKDGASSSVEKPQLVNTVISDFTPEAMMKAHSNNPRGIAVVVDEIKSLFNSVKRYNGKNNLIETLLTAYNGEQLKVSRKGEDIPIVIKTPCINLVGTTQTRLLPEIFGSDYVDNGFLDRFLFVQPTDQHIQKWRNNTTKLPIPNSGLEWERIVCRILELFYSVESGPRVLELTPEAQQCFFDWYNSIVEELNSVEKDKDADGRKNKHNGKAARLALIFQVLRWATGEADMNQVDIVSLKAAIAMMEYFELNYQRVQNSLMEIEIGDAEDIWFSSLKDSFTTADVRKLGNDLGIARRTVFYMLERAIKRKLVERTGHGKYCKLIGTAPCTIALSDSGTAPSMADSAKVQSAISEKRWNYE